MPNRIEIINDTSLPVTVVMISALVWQKYISIWMHPGWDLNDSDEIYLCRGFGDTKMAFSKFIKQYEFNKIKK